MTRICKGASKLHSTCPKLEAYESAPPLQPPPPPPSHSQHHYRLPPVAVGIPSSQPAKKATPLPTSSIPAGTILRGLNFLKGRDDPVALKEEEYPEWLWHCLDKKKAVDGAEETGGDEFSKSKKLRRQAAKARRKAEERALLSGDTSMLEVKVPIQQQSIDLPSEGEAALEQRADLRKAMRKERRAKIKEGNYLKGM
ncbi:hypothetical protein NHQ30_011645 [Ciborinia camelliae]|nr:hypothetical protein NHQ30_011645 [Ciborinia camelliae]